MEQSSGIPTPPRPTTFDPTWEPPKVGHRLPRAWLEPMRSGLGDGQTCRDALDWVISSIWEEIESLGQSEAGERATFPDIAPERILVVGIQSFAGQVNNGGFDQFYWNSSGEIAQDLPGWLRTIGREDLAGMVESANAVFPGGPMVESANAVFPGGPPRDRTQRQELHDALTPEQKDVWEALNDRFFDLDRNYIESLVRHVVAHSDLFFEPGDTG